jgi:signal peptidase I
VKIGWRRALLGRHPSRTLVRVGVLILVGILTFGWLIVPVRAYGPSMLPTYRDGGLYFVNRVAYAWRKPRRGDVVAIRLAGPHVLYVKRIVGLPGERVLIRRGVVHVNGTPLDEPYVVNRSPWQMREVSLESNEYFVVGDNRGMRMELHDLGTVRRDRIVGQMLW